MYSTFNEYLLPFSNFFSSIVHILRVFDLDLANEVNLDNTLSSSNYYKVYFFFFPLFFLLFFFASISAFTYYFYLTKCFEYQNEEHKVN